jgi:predicted transposase YbfD/YdcC
MEEYGIASEDWLRTFLELPDGIPSHDTFNRFFSALDPNAFLECFLSWTQSLREFVSQEVVAIDGKALRRALNKDKSIPCVVSAWADSNSLVLGQLKVNDKSNEITAVPELLRALELNGCIVTLDAMGCQKNIVKEVREAGADYVVGLKGNHEILHAEVQLHMEKVVTEFEVMQKNGTFVETKSTVAKYSTSEKGHGRFEDRTYYQSTDLTWFQNRKEWEGVKSVGVVETMREVNGKRSFESRYFLTSLPLDIQTFARGVRHHWSVENKLHWTMDMPFGEDQSRARTGYAAENLAALRRLALNILKKENSKKRSIRTKMLVASCNHDFLLRLLGL